MKTIVGRIVTFDFFDKLTSGIVVKQENYHLEIKTLFGAVIKTTLHHVQVREC